MENSLENWLKQNQIEFILHEHTPVYTVEEAREYCSHILGLHCKNLFLKDSKSGKFFLLTLPATKSIALNLIRRQIRAKKLSFANPDELFKVLRLEPGSVSPFGLLYDNQKVVTFLIDQEVWNAPRVCFHPNVNYETIELTQNDFQKYIHLAKVPKILLEL